MERKIADDILDMLWHNGESNLFCRDIIENRWKDKWTMF